MNDNQLGAATSPYLLQHAGNPVAWREWGDRALAEAREQDKPILLSVGYAACHWCHVMAHESFENPAIADLMNRHFVNIKVDREERPDIDHIYQMALALTGQQGGWPLTMFLTPQGEPFFGGTYFPATANYGRPGFADILGRVAGLFANKDPAITRNRDALLARLTEIAAEPTAGAIPADILDSAPERLLGHVDPVHGGLGGAPKFPQSFVFELFWRAALRTGKPQLREAVLTTLDHIAQGGIYDHLGGGFARYAVDQRWLVPHFEKMLYDNALLVRLYTLVWQETGKPLHAARVAETMGWLAREMRVPGGGFAASLDADSEGVEGKFYVWSDQEIAALLAPEDARLFMEVYDVRPGGNWEGVTILNRLRSMDLLDPESEARLAACRKSLFDHRASRVRPGRDDKVLADWNGMMIGAAARAATVFDRPDWLALGRAAFDHVRTFHGTPDGRLRHASRAGRTGEVGLLDDHAWMIHAALELHEASGEAGFLDQARAWCDRVEDHFADRDHGGFFTTADDAESLILRSRSAHDAAQPSGNGTMVQNYARLFHLTGDPGYATRARALVAAFGGEAGRNPFALVGLLNGLDTLEHGIAISFFGDPPDPALLAALHTLSLPAGVVRRLPEGGTLAPSDPLAGLQAPAGNVVICAHQTCSLPIREPARLVAELRARRGLEHGRGEG